MRAVLAILIRCVLVLGLGFTPVANALDMADMAAQQDKAPPCHAPSQGAQQTDGKCCATTGHCHCAMATALPVELPIVMHPLMTSDHPQTVRPLTLEQSDTPDTPPPRA